jgi:3-oxoacyl-[acyl-carrier protein] reductase
MSRKEMIALVTGAAQGIGRGIALRLARDGADLVLLDIAAEALQSVREEVAGLGRRAVALHVDISDTRAVADVFGQVEEAWGRIDILVNNAGIMRITPLVDVSEAEWDQILAINLKAAFFCLQAVARSMICQRYGRIINIASVSGLGARPDHIHYASAKAGVISLTKSAAVALAPHGITVNAVCPGMVDTPMTKTIHATRSKVAGTSPEASAAKMLERIPVGRIATPADVATAVAFFASAETSYVTGQVLSVDGGLGLL